MSEFNIDNKNGMPHGDEPLLPALDIIYSWRSTWLRAIAVAWSDDNFKSVLLDDSQKAFDMLGFTGQSENVSLWNLLHIKVVESPTDASDPDAGVVKVEIPVNHHIYSPKYESVMTDVNGNEKIVQRFEENGWKESVVNGALKMYLILQLPPKPLTDSKDLALIDYDAAGKIYPFTAS